MRPLAFDFLRGHDFELQPREQQTASLGLPVRAGRRCNGADGAVLQLSDLKLTALFAPVLVHNILKLYRLCV